MKLQSGIDYILVKRAGYFDGGRTLQQHGNLVVTRNRIIINILQTIDVMEKMNSGDARPKSANPFKEIKEATRDMTQSFKDAKDDFRKMKDFGYVLQILEGIATEAESLEELEARAAAMGEDNPKSLNITLTDIQSVKIGWFGPVRIMLNNGLLLKLFIAHHRKDVKRFLAQYIKI